MSLDIFFCLCLKAFFVAFLHERPSKRGAVEYRERSCPVLSYNDPVAHGRKFTTSVSLDRCVDILARLPRQTSQVCARKNKTTPRKTGELFFLSSSDLTSRCQSAISYAFNWAYGSSGTSDLVRGGLIKNDKGNRQFALKRGALTTRA